MSDDFIVRAARELLALHDRVGRAEAELEAEKRRHDRWIVEVSDPVRDNLRRERDEALLRAKSLEDELDRVSTSALKCVRERDEAKHETERLRGLVDEAAATFHADIANYGKLAAKLQEERDAVKHLLPG